LSGNKSGEDYTEKLVAESKRVAQSYIDSDICGIIFKSKSPTCAMDSIKNYLPNGFSEGKTSGVLFDQFRELYPLLPMEEEGRLGDVWLRENFVMRIFVYRDMLKFSKSAIGVGELVEFHTSYKFLLQAKSEKLYRELGNLVANRDNLQFEDILTQYRDIFFRAIGEKSSVERNINVIQHMYGFLKRVVSEDEKSEFLRLLEEYRNRVVPMIVPISILRLFSIKYGVDYLLNQKFLSPYPEELALRSYISEK
jgi:uncharacterized protein YbgA (DUF1722 family)